MKVKYKNIEWEFESRTYEQLRKAVLLNEPSLNDKSWMFAYRDAQGDEVLLETEEDLSDTIEFYQSCHKTFVLMVKQTWWKDKIMKKRSCKRISETSARRSDSKVSGQGQSSDPDSSNSSDDEYIDVDVRPGEYFYEDSEPPVTEIRSSIDLQNQQLEKQDLQTLTIRQQQKQSQFFKLVKPQSSFASDPIKPIEFTL